VSDCIRFKGCGAPTPCSHHISGTISSPFRGAFHLSLTVLSAIDLCIFLALEGGPPSFRPDYTCPTLLRNSLPFCTISPTGLSPSLAALSRVVWLWNKSQILGSYNPPHPLNSHKLCSSLFFNMANDFPYCLSFLSRSFASRAERYVST
jgi:hypothetical protein